MCCKVYEFGLPHREFGRNYKNPCKEKLQLPCVQEFLEDPFKMTLEHKET